MKPRTAKVVRVCSAPMTFETLLYDQVREIDRWVDLTLVADFGDKPSMAMSQTEIPLMTLPIVRSVSPLSDAKAVWQLVRYLRSARPGVVHSVTPKAGLVAMLAGAIARVPHRFHTFTGQVWETSTGLQRAVLLASDRLIARFATEVFCDSQSQRDQLIDAGVARPGEVKVLGSGSLSGVNLERFDANRASASRVDEIRTDLGLGPQSTVVLFLGRLARDKGVDALVRAFERVAQDKEVSLILAGPMDERDPIEPSTLNRIDNNQDIHLAGYTEDPESYFAASHIFCLPSHREGFGSVVIEAGAMGLPVVATKATGLVDSVVDGLTGFLVEIDDVDELAGALATLVEDPDLRRTMGESGRKRAIHDFDSEVVNGLVVERYLQVTDPE